VVESAATVEGATAHTSGAARNTCARSKDLTAATHSTSGRPATAAHAAAATATHVAATTATHVAAATATHVAATTATHVATAAATVAAATALSKRRRSAKREHASQSDGRHE
jgi:hypothetical protein